MFVLLSATIVLAHPSSAEAAAIGTVMQRTQRMSGPSLETSQSGWYEKGAKVTLICHQQGQPVKGYYSPWLPNGGWDNLWYLVDDGYFIADVDTDTGSNDPVAPACPVPFATSPRPTISGKVAVGSTLSASVGAWSPAATLSYQWKLGGKVVSTSATWVVPATAAGKSLTLSVAGSRTGYVTTTKTSVAAKVASGTITASKPAISGTPSVGQTLTAKPGSWSPSPSAFTFQWYRGTAKIGGATGSTYKVASADRGQKISVTVTGAKSGYTAATRASDGVLIQNALAATPKPKITGTAQEGKKLTAQPGTWKPAPVTLAYQWYRAGVAIPKATSKTYLLTAADVGASITVKVTGTKAGYAQVTTASAGVTPIGSKISGAIPTISGTAKAGSTLTANPGTWSPSPVSLAYQWYVNGAPAGGATGSTWVVPVWAATKSVSVTVTGTRQGYSAVARTSAQVTVSSDVGSSVGPGNSMPPGSMLRSGNGSYTFVVQGDGNLVVYKGSSAIWSSKTNGQAPREFAIQGDGNLVLYRTDGRAVWASNTAGKSIRGLVMQDDGNLVLYATNGSAVWASNTAPGSGGGPGVNGWVYPIQPHSKLTTYGGHNGDDFPVGIGTPVYAMAGGSVKITSYPVSSSWCPVQAAIGRTQTDLIVTSSRDGHSYAIDYAHLSQFSVANGSTVAAGQLLGYSGQNGCVTGPHLHVDIKVDGRANVLYPHDIFGWSY